jgi:hypothetical protein
MKTKALAAWAALLLGAFGAHRFYLHGPRDRWALAHPLPTLMALVGLQQMELQGVDAPAVTWALPLLGIMVAIGALNAILIGLTQDDIWNARHNPGKPAPASRWAPVLAAVFGLLIGGTALMAAITFAAQRYFELTQ